jgi:hypothetical protein
MSYADGPLASKELACIDEGMSTLVDSTARFLNEEAPLRARSQNLYDMARHVYVTSL